jgi:uncharacterized protein
VPEATATAGAGAAPTAERLPIVDADIHNFPLPDELMARLPRRWRRYVEDFGIRTAWGEAGVIRARWMGSRQDAWTPSGKPPGSDLDFLRLQLLDAFDIDYGILNNSMAHAGVYAGGGAPAEFTHALMRAGNEWGAEAWDDPRLYQTMLVPYEDADAAVAEVEHWEGNPRFLQVGMPVRTQRPFGHRKYRPLIDACAERDLPLVFHVGYGQPGPLTGAGWPSFYYEDHVNFPQALYTHIASLICEGVFDRWPNLKVVLQETGWTWVAPFAWRFDRAFAQVGGRELPDLRRLPSEYVRDHLWYTTQPWEESPADPAHAAEAMEIFAAFGGEDRLLFASDYPHWDFDSPAEASGLIADERLRRKIMAGNALALYDRLPAPRP